MRKRWTSLVGFLALLPALSIHGQTPGNMVFNPSFEEHRDCPTKLDALGVMKEADAWWQPTRGSSDYFNACGSRDCQVPRNKMGLQAAHSGEAYCGIYCSQETYREYLQTELKEPLVPGRRYRMSFCNPKKQADFYLNIAQLEPGDLPPVLDIEKKGDLTPQQLRRDVKIWLDLVEKEYGVKPILYTGYKFKVDYLNTPEFDAYPYWIAHYYVEKLAYKGKWTFWQHTDCGKVSGIKGFVDCNIFNGTFEDLQQLTLPEPEME